MRFVQRVQTLHRCERRNISKRRPSSHRNIMPATLITVASTRWRHPMAEFTTVLLFLMATGGAWASATGSDVTSTCRLRDVEQRSRDCLAEFNTQVDAMRIARHKFFTGVDVETIRSVCHWFQASVSCIRTVRSECQWTKDTEEIANNLLRPHWPLFSFCQRDSLYEDYAVSQFCFQRVRHHSDECFADFGRSANGLVSDIWRTNEHQRMQALQHYCGHLKRLVHCIKSDVRAQCNKVAARLVEVLVNASVELSPLCTSDVINRTTTPFPSSSFRPGYGSSNATPALPYRRQWTLSCSAFWTLLMSLIVSDRIITWSSWSARGVEL